MKSRQRTTQANQEGTWTVQADRQLLLLLLQKKGGAQLAQCSKPQHCVTVLTLLYHRSSYTRQSVSLARSDFAYQECPGKLKIPSGGW